MNDVFKEAPNGSVAGESRPPPMAVSRAAGYLESLCGRPLGEILKAVSGLTQEKLEEALTLQAEKGGRIGEVLVGLKAVTEEEIAKALSIQLDVPYVARISTDDVDPELVKKIPINYAKQARILPLRQEGGAIRSEEH